MPIDLAQGGNATVADAVVSATIAFVAAEGRAVEADAIAFLLDGTGQVRGDTDMVFYNQPRGGDGAVRFTPRPGRDSFSVDLAAMPPEIARIVFCLAIHEAASKDQTLALIDGAAIGIEGERGAIRFTPPLAGARETAMALGELYRRGGGWKFRAVGQGYAGGLVPLAGGYGIMVADAPPATIDPPMPPRRPTRLRLEAAGEAVVHVPGPAGPGEIAIGLNWSRARGAVFGGQDAIDLDLGCLFELADGRRGAVQAIGGGCGCFEAAPFIQLTGDDRTGGGAGETLRINGGAWGEVRRLVLFANIHDGVPDWGQTDAILTVTVPDHPLIEIRLTEGIDSRRMCAVALLQNDGGRIHVTRIVDYVRDQQELDHRFGWGIRWVAGVKD